MVPCAFSTLCFLIIESTLCFFESWLKQNGKPRILGRTGMIFGLHGVVFHGADATDAQKCTALQNITNKV